MGWRLGPWGGIVCSVLHCVDVATRRMNSSLRSHRAQRSLCRCACPGLDKTLFASAGPNSHGRGHRRDTTPVAAEGLQAGEDGSSPGRMKPGRGHRLDGTSAPRSVAGRARCARQARPADATMIPHTMASIFPSHGDSGLRSVFRPLGPRPRLGARGEKRGRRLPGRRGSVGGRCFFSSFSFASPGPVGRGEVVRRLGTIVGGAVSHHGVQGSQQSPAHGDVGLGFADAFDQSLAKGLLPGVGPAERDAGLAEGPPQGHRAGLGDVSGLGASGGFVRRVRSPRR